MQTGNELKVKKNAAHNTQILFAKTFNMTKPVQTISSSRTAPTTMQREGV